MTNQSKKEESSIGTVFAVTIIVVVIGAIIAFIGASFIPRPILKYSDAYAMAKQVYRNTMDQPDSQVHKEAAHKLKTAALEYKSFLQLRLPEVSEEIKESYREDIREIDELLKLMD